MSDTFCGFVALIGAPNAGKSTLINALVGSKVSVVSRKAQTTRTSVRGIVIEGAAQIIFVDTPGLFAPKRRLDRAMAASAWGAAADADVLALLIDSRQEIQASASSGRAAPAHAPSDVPPGERPPPASLSEQTEEILRALRDSKTPKALVLNKIDLVDRPALLSLAAKLNAAVEFKETFMVSAATGDGLDKLRERLGRMMPPGPWLYPEDQITDAPLRSLAAEITREKLFERLHDELPYQATVETDQWKTLPDGSVRIEQTIFVTRDSHKKIVIGEGGRTIKAIGSAARKEIAEANDGPVHLFLFVKVRANWLDDPERYRAMGLEFPKS
jgi:GTP-binding protein Era